MFTCAGSSPDPFSMPEYSFQNEGFHDTFGFTPLTSTIAAPSTTKGIILAGQSNFANSIGTSAYTPTQAGSTILNPYDGGLYAAADPVLGSTPHPANGAAGARVSSVAMVIADRLITNGDATQAIVCSVSVGGTTYEQWDPSTANSLWPRLRTAILRFRALGLEPDRILWAQGENNNGNGTLAAVVTNAINNIVAATRAAPVSCNTPFYFGKFTMLAGVTSAQVQTGIANALDAGNHVLAGYDADTNATVAGGYRIGGTHLSNTGRTLVGQGTADLIYP